MSMEFSYFPINIAQFCVYFYGDLQIFPIFHLYNIITMFNASCLHICYLLNLLIHYSLFYIKGNYPYLLKYNK